MSKIKLETITPVHISSGVELTRDLDYIKQKDDDGDYFAVIDINKVFKEFENLPEEQQKKYINSLVNSIDSGESIDKAFECHPNKKFKLDKYTLRKIAVDDDKSQTMKEAIHLHDGTLYIPGSSIKGAIRTAVLATGAKEGRHQKTPIKYVEDNIFGKNPQESAFRFLQVGDAHFSDYDDFVSVAFVMNSINERKNKGFWDDKKSCMVEALDCGLESTFTLNIKKEHYNIAKDKVASLPKCMNSVKDLFATINNHTLDLLHSEKDYWEKREELDNEDVVLDYLDKIDNLIKIAKDYKNTNSCLLRVGYASGWRFMTGAWTEGRDNFKTEVVPMARPRNYLYKDYDFPKTRRVSSRVELLGFVKLTIEEE